MTATRRARKHGGLAVVTEAQFQAAVLDLARLRKWIYYHTYDSRHSPAGFPDLVLVRATRIVFAELKTNRGRVSVAQSVWLRALQVLEATTAGAVSVHVWRPADWGTIERILA